MPFLRCLSIDNIYYSISKKGVYIYIYIYLYYMYVYIYIYMYIYKKYETSKNVVFGFFTI